jgi:hypothetical protein
VIEIVIWHVIKLIQDKGAQMTTQTLSRPDLLAHDASIRLDFSALVKELQLLLGSKLVAYIGSVSEVRAVNQWAAAIREPGEATKQRLRLAFHITRMIRDVDGPKITVAWFQGLNPYLEDRSPARLIREGELDEVGPQILNAARSLLQAG